MITPSKPNLLPYATIWGEEGNFTQVPNILIREFKELGLTKNEANLLEILMSYGLEDCTIPTSRLAHDMGLTTGRTRVYIRSLCDKKFLHRQFHKGYSNIYGSTYSWKGAIKKIRAYIKNRPPSISKLYIPPYINDSAPVKESSNSMTNSDVSPVSKLHTNKEEELNKKETPGHDKFLKDLNERKRRSNH